MSDTQARAWAKNHLPLLRSSYGPALDEVAWNTDDAIYPGRVKFVAQYRCGGDGRSVIVPRAQIEADAQNA